MRQITYAAPGSVEAAAAILAEHGARARMLAGGTDLIVQIREWLRDVDVVVDAKHIPELMDIGFAEDGAMTLGAATPCYRIYGDERVARTYPGLIDAVSMIGGTAIQGGRRLAATCATRAGGRLHPAADRVLGYVQHSGS